MLLHPGDHGWQDFAFEIAFIADEVVVDHVQVALVAELAQQLQFGHHLLRFLEAGLAAVKFDDIAEFAVERTATRYLHADAHVFAKIVRHFLLALTARYQ